MKRFGLLMLFVSPLYCMNEDASTLAQLRGFKDTKGNTILHLASAQGSKKLVKLICNQVGVHKQAGNKLGNTALHEASYYGHFQIVRHLIDIQGMNPNQENKFGETALHHAAEGGHLPIVRYLLKKTDVDFRKKNVHGYNPCELAAFKQYRPVVNCCIQSLGKRSRAENDSLQGEKKSKRNEPGFCPICLDNVPKAHYNVTNYSCMHFLCGPCKWQLKARPKDQQRCPLCRIPIS